MSFDWQFVVVVACVIWAVAVLIMRGYGLVHQPASSSCGSGGCYGCPSNSTQQTSGLIQLGAPVQLHTRIKTSEIVPTTGSMSPATLEEIG